jgi:hypothetical protein
MKNSRVQEAIKILRASADGLYVEEKPKARKSVKGSQTKAAKKKRSK